MDKIKKLLLIINPCAGKKKSKHKLFGIADAFCKHNCQVTIEPTRKSGDATEIVKKYGKDYDLIACCGGDGTLNEVTAGIMTLDNPPPVGYVPTGSTNDFAETLGLASSIEENVDIACEGAPAKMDIGLFNGRIFNYIACFGIFSDASYRANQKAKNIFGHAAYLAYGADSFFKGKPQHLKIETDTETYEGEFSFGAVTSSLSVGGIFKYDPELVKVDDGLFEMLFIKTPQKKVKFLNVALEALKGNLGEEHIIFTRSSKVKITGPEDMDWALDGEYQKGCSEILIENKKQALTIMVPPAEEEETEEKTEE